MGTLLAAVCECGYSQPRLAFGEGWAGFQEHCRVPARCDACREVVLVDYLGGRIPDAGAVDRDSFTCPSCAGRVVVCAEFRPDPPPAQPGGMTWKVPGGQLILPTSGNLCPACGSSTLSFETTGMFD
jgi:hypothetical protein